MDKCDSHKMMTHYLFWLNLRFGYISVRGDGKGVYDDQIHEVQLTL